MYRRNGFDSRRDKHRTPRLEMAVWQETIEDVEPDAPGRVEILHYDPNDPYSCVCYPKPSSILIPSMVYDEIRCPHPEKHHLQPAQDDVFAYPWTVQTYEPPLHLHEPKSLVSRKRLVRPPPSAKTAPPFAHKGLLQNTKPNPPFTAPAKHVQVPRLNLKLLDDRSKISATPALSTINEDDLYRPRDKHLEFVHYDGPDNQEITQFDSVSQVHAARPTPNNFRYPERNYVRNTPIRDVPARNLLPGTRDILTRDLPTRHNFYGQSRDAVTRDHYPGFTPPNNALPTPLPRPTTNSMLATPNRLFTGQYVDPRSGKKYEYKVKYGKKTLDGNKRLLTA